MVISSLVIVSSFGLFFLLSAQSGRLVLLFGTSVVASDYRFLQAFGKDSWYRWIQKNVADEVVNRKIADAKEQKLRELRQSAVKKYERSQFLTRGPDQIEVESKGSGNFVGQADTTVDCVHPGLQFHLIVDMEVDDNGLSYPLRVAKLEVTKVEETTEADRAVIVIFLSVTEWLDDEWEHPEEKERLTTARENLESGGSEDRLSVKPIKSGDVNEFDTGEWKSIVDWISGR